MGRDIQAVLPPPPVPAAVEAGTVGWHTIPDFPTCWTWTPAGCVPQRAVLTFDLDSTLVDTKSGATFAKNSSDWQWLFPEVPRVLQAAAASGFKLAIMSNQLGVSKGQVTLADVQGRMEQVVAAAGVPMQCFFSTNNDFFRKPRPGMWAVLAALCNGGVAVDTAASMYVGDAAGRPAGGPGHPKKDFSAGDLLFALNTGVPFQTPEEFFLKSPVDPTVGTTVTPLPKAVSTVETLQAANTFAGTHPEIVVLVGPPAAGKSTLSTTLLHKYSRVNQDLLKTKKKCLDAAAAFLAAGKPVVIDATNKDASTRRDWIDLAAAHRVPIRALLLDVSKDQW